MKATVLDLRRRMKDVLDSLRRNEPVTLMRRGKVVGTIQPAGVSSGCQTGKPSDRAASSHAAFGLWRDRTDLRDVDAAVERLRKARDHAH